MKRQLQAPCVVAALIAAGLLAQGTPSGAASNVNPQGGMRTQTGPKQLPAAPPTFQITGVEACSCSDGALKVFFTATNIPSGAKERILVVVNGVVYTDQVGSYLTGTVSDDWGFGPANQGGTATGTWPLPSGQPITIIFTVEQPLGSVLTGWKMVLDGCGNCNILSSAEYFGAGVPATSPLGLAALAALLLLVGVFAILRLRA